ncbi:DUF3265 domain-containing protein, partial [Vibrio vulnificus]|nr:DUF3265 domain-containing protein [Vibrio vulnificus]
YAVSFGGESGLRKVGLGGTHPLTRRYVLHWRNKRGISIWLVVLMHIGKDLIQSTVIIHSKWVAKNTMTLSEVGHRKLSGSPTL